MFPKPYSKRVRKGPLALKLSCAIARAMAFEPTYLFGRHPVLELLQARPQALEQVFLLQENAPKRGRSGEGREGLAQQLADAGVGVQWVAMSVLERLVGPEATHQGIVAQVAPFAYQPLDRLLPPAPTPALLICLDQIQDPHNLGALCRSALALGAHGLIIGQDRCAEVNGTAIKAAAGATAHLPIARVVNISRALASLKEKGLWAVGTAPGGQTPLHRVDFTMPTVLVIGSEGAGMRPLVTKQCDVLTQIPITTIGSLNASVAGGICLYEAARQRSATSFPHAP
jgi:23S rRNA (guanosine2251-2'-O)-methyltransferase